MREIDVFEAKTHLSEILDAVEAGERWQSQSAANPLPSCHPHLTKWNKDALQQPS